MAEELTDDAKITKAIETLQVGDTLSLEDKEGAEKIINCIFDYLEVKLPWLPGKNLILGASRKLCLNTIPYLFIFFGERGLELKLKK